MWEKVIVYRRKTGKRVRLFRITLPAKNGFSARVVTVTAAGHYAENHKNQDEGRHTTMHFFPGLIWLVIQHELNAWFKSTQTHASFGLKLRKPLLKLKLTHNLREARWVN